ncbi:MAG: hypothetical protein HYS58_03955 [Elusimicrobia bacterium]|nr:hypothetical protein [Elusimicrobiota bacterium]
MPFQLGVYFTHPNAQPNKILEILLTPLVLGLVWLGIQSCGRRGYLLCMVLPFLISGVLAFYRDYNYAYFKNFTYLYYWIPICFGLGIFWIIGRMKTRWKSIAGWGVLLMALFILFQSAANTFNRVSHSVRSSMLVKKNLMRMEEPARNPEINDLFISNDLSYWETLWAAYYFRDRNIGSEFFNDSLVSEDTGKKPFQFILTQTRIQTLLPSIDESNLTEKVFESGEYAIYRIPNQKMRKYYSITLDRGFYHKETNEEEQWVWMGQAATLHILSPENQTQANIDIKLSSRQDQNLEILKDGVRLDSLPLTMNGRKSYRFRIPLQKGNNVFSLRTDRNPPPKIGTDPRELNLQIFRIRVLEVL